MQEKDFIKRSPSFEIEGSTQHLEWVICSVNFLDLTVNFLMQKIGSSGKQNATRCGLWWVEMLKTRDQYKEAASVYFRISGEVIPHFLNRTLGEIICCYS